MKMYIANELGCVYRFGNHATTPKGAELEWCPLRNDNTFDFDAEGGYVDEDIVGQEIVTFQGKEQTLSEVYRFVESKLQ